MEHVVMPLFPIPIYISKIEDISKAKEQVKHLEFKRLGIDNGDSTINKRILDDPAFQQMRSDIMKHVENFTKNSLKISNHIVFKIQNSWAMKHKKGDFSQNHLHVNSILSGIVYLDVDKISGNLVLHKDPNYSNLFPPAIDLPFDERNIFNSKTWSFTPEEGQIFIFPSNLTHSVETSMSDNLRYCIAFNLFPSGSLGLEHAEAMAVLRL